MKYEDLEFRLYDVGEMRTSKKYEVTVFTQLKDGEDLSVNPFWFATDDRDEAFEVFDLLMSHEDDVHERCLSLLDDIRDEIEWFDVYVTENRGHGVYEDLETETL